MSVKVEKEHIIVRLSPSWSVLILRSTWREWQKLKGKDREEAIIEWYKDFGRTREQAEKFLEAFKRALKQARSGGVYT